MSDYDEEWQDNDDDFSEYEESPFVQQEVSYDDIQRTEIGGHYWKVTPEGKPAKIQGPDERFCLAVDAIGRNLDLDQGTIEYLLATSTKLDRIQYKNPAAYILGYLASRPRLTKDTLAHAIKLLKKVDDVKAADVLRYARLWESLK